jgi:integrase
LVKVKSLVALLRIVLIWTGQGWRGQNPRIADVLLVLGWTGMRWSEARAVRVEDLMRVPTPGLMVRRAAPEGVGVKSTKGRRSRRVPLGNRVLPLVLAMAEGKEPGDLLFTTHGGAQLHRTATLCAVAWHKTSFGPHSRPPPHGRLLVAGARRGPGNRAGMDGSQSIATTNLYLHFLGTGAHRAGLERLNLPRGRREPSESPFRGLQP